MPKTYIKKITTSKAVQKLFREMAKSRDKTIRGKKWTMASIKALSMCEHGHVGYKAIEKLAKHQYKLNWKLIALIENIEAKNTKLTNVVAEMEDKFSNVQESLSWLIKENSKLETCVRILKSSQSKGGAYDN